MANQHTTHPTRKITLPTIPGVTIGATPPRGKTHLEAAQERRIPVVVAQDETGRPVTRPTIAEAYLLDLLRTGPKTAADLAASLGIVTDRVSTTLRNMRKKGQVVMHCQRSKSASSLWALPGKGVRK